MSGPWSRGLGGHCQRLGETAIASQTSPCILLASGLAALLLHWCHLTFPEEVVFVDILVVDWQAVFLSVYGSKFVIVSRDWAKWLNCLHRCKLQTNGYIITPDLMSRVCQLLPTTKRSNPTWLVQLVRFCLLSAKLHLVIQIKQTHDIQRCDSQSCYVPDNDVSQKKRRHSV